MTLPQTNVILHAFRTNDRKNAWTHHCKESPMPDFITLTCPSCGGKLKVTDQIHLLACRNCGNEHMVHRDAGMIYLAPLTQDVRHIRIGVDKTAAELAVVRLSKELVELNGRLAAIRERPASDWQPPLKKEKIAPIVAVVALLFSCGGLSASNYGQVVVMGVVFLICGLVYLITNHKRLNAAHGMKQAELQRLQEHGSDLSARLRKNRQVADA
jgi:predicted RNA-binding Zn-ribbon protein involved in translation (DUF1610 family)